MDFCEVSASETPTVVAAASLELVAQLAYRILAVIWTNCEGSFFAED